MDRYQFEDLISDTIENNLSMSRRKQVEAYIEEHPEAKEQLNAVKTMMASLNALPEVTASSYFMGNLQQRIAREKETKPIYKRKFAGYVPLMAGLSAVVVVVVVLLGLEFIPTETVPATMQPLFTEDDVVIPGQDSPMLQEEDNFADNEADSLKTEEQSEKSKFNNRIQLVKDQHR